MCCGLDSSQYCLVCSLDVNKGRTPVCIARNSILAASAWLSSPFFRMFSISTYIVLRWFVVFVLQMIHFDIPVDSVCDWLCALLQLLCSRGIKNLFCTELAISFVQIAFDLSENMSCHFVLCLLGSMQTCSVLQRSRGWYTNHSALIALLLNSFRSLWTPADCYFPTSSAFRTVAIVMICVYLFLSFVLCFSLCALCCQRSFYCRERFVNVICRFWKKYILLSLTQCVCLCVCACAYLLSE